MIETIAVVAVALLAALIFALVVAVVAYRNAEHWRLLMLRLNELPSRVDLAVEIERAVDASIGKRLPTAEQFEATVKAMMTAREQRANGRDGEGRA